MVGIQSWDNLTILQDRAHHLWDLKIWRSCLQKIESEFSYTVGHPAGERNTHMFGDQKLSEAKQHWEYRSILRVEFQGGTVEIFPLGGIFAKSTAHDPDPCCRDQQPRLIIHLIETGGTGNVQSDHKWVTYYFRISSLWKKKILKQNQVSTLSKWSEEKEKLVVKSYFKSPWTTLPVLISHGLVSFSGN